MFIVVYIVIDSIQKLLGTPSHTLLLGCKDIVTSVLKHHSMKVCRGLGDKSSSHS